MQSIIDANKTYISINDLPELSREIINKDHNDYNTIDVMFAEKFGYEVYMGGKGYRIGKQNKIYFNIFSILRLFT